MPILLSKMNISFSESGGFDDFESCSTLTNLEISIGSSTLNYTLIFVKVHRKVFRVPKLQISESPLDPPRKGAFDAP